MSQRVLITAGAAGIGREFARAFAGKGAKVFVCDIDEKALSAIGKEIPGITARRCDMVNRAEIERMVPEAVEVLGGLDVLINNASELGPTPLRLLSDTECEDLEHVFAANVFGPFRLTKALMGALAASAREGRGAVVLNVTSDAAVNAYPNWGAYGSSKAALHHMSRIWNEEHEGDGVRFLSLDPGDMDTPMHAAAIPDADPATLKRPEVSAREFVEAIAEALPRIARS